MTNREKINTIAPALRVLLGGADRPVRIAFKEDETSITAKTGQGVWGFKNMNGLSSSPSPCNTVLR